MKRLGKLTGKVYPDDYDFSQCPECCVQITDELAQDRDAIQAHHVKDVLSCFGCFGCPAAEELKV